MAEDRVGWNGSPSRVDAPDRRHERRELCGETHGFAVIRLRRIVGGILIVMTKGGRQCSKGVHAGALAPASPRRSRQCPHQADDRLGQLTSSYELRLQIAELRARRQPPVPEEEADFLERRVSREVVNVIAAISEHAAIAVEITDRRRGRYDVFEPALGLRGHGHGEVMISERFGPDRVSSLAVPALQGFDCRGHANPARSVCDVVDRASALSHRSGVGFEPRTWSGWLVHSRGRRDR